MNNSRKQIIITSAVAGLITLLLFLRALSGEFLNYDDGDFAQYNLAIRNLDANLISYAFTSIPSFSGIWTPLVWISFAVDYHFWGLDPLGYRLTNILLHAVNAFLVVLVANRLYMAKSVKPFFSSDSNFPYLGMLLLAGLLFGIHPLRVESVAWISERKDVLNGVFALSSILFYLRYAHGKESTEENVSTKRDYTVSLLFLLLSFMAKPVSVVIPVMLLVLDWYPLNRLNRGTIRSVLIEKTPYFVLMTGMITLTLYMGASEGGLLVPTEFFSFGQRFITSGNALFEYMRLMLYPVGILPIHLLTTPIPVSHTVKTVIIIFICIYFCITRKRSWPLATWLCFIMPILPVLAFFQTNTVAFAARYTYLPSVMPSIAGAALIAVLYDKARVRGKGHSLRLLTAGLSFGLLIFYAVMTQRLIDIWKDSDTFWTRQITHQPFDKAYFLRGGYYVSVGKYPAAVDDFTSCLDIILQEKMPQSFIVNVLAFRGDALAKGGRYEDAVKDFSAAIAMIPQPVYYYHRGVALKALGKLGDAEGDFKIAGEAKGIIRWF